MSPTVTISASSWITATTKSVAISWNAGDLVVVMGVVENNSTNSNIQTPTVTGLTFSVLDTDTTSGSPDHCWGGSWTATAASAGSGSVSASTVSGNPHFGIVVIVVSSGTYTAVGAHTRANDSSGTSPISVIGPRSTVFAVVGDFNVGTGSGYLPAGGTQMGGAGIGSQDLTHYTPFGASWTSQSAGSTSYGINPASGGPWTKIIVEVEGLNAVGVPWVRA